MQDGQDQTSLRERMNGMNNIFMLIARSFAVSLEVFFHHRFGESYLGVTAVGATVSMFLWPLLLPNENAEPLLVFWMFFVLACVLARLSILHRIGTNRVEHSYYTGRPWLMLIFRRFNEVTVKRYIEPPLGILAGSFLSAVSPTLGSYVICAAIAMGICLTSDLHRERRQAQTMFDAYLDQQSAADRFRRMRGE